MTDEPNPFDDDDADPATLAAEERTDDAEVLAHVAEDQEEETPFDETRLQYTGVEEDSDRDMDVRGLAESGALFDDPNTVNDDA